MCLRVHRSFPGFFLIFFHDLIVGNSISCCFHWVSCIPSIVSEIKRYPGLLRVSWFIIIFFPIFPMPEGCQRLSVHSVSHICAVGMWLLTWCRKYVHWIPHISSTTGPFEVKLQRRTFPIVPFLTSPKSSCGVEFWISQFNPGWVLGLVHWVYSLIFYSLISPSFSSGLNAFGS